MKSLWTSVMAIVVLFFLLAGAANAQNWTGFLYSGGTYTTISPPGATYTYVYGINKGGQIVGYYSTASGTYGFLYSGGSYTTISPPGAAGTFANAINDAGQITGYSGYNYNPSPYQGFLYSGGSYSTISPPGSTETLPSAINNAGQITGTSNASGQQSFIYSGGTYNTISFPGATTTYARAINDAGQITGYYANASEASFLYSGGTYSTISFPGATYAWTDGINNAGQVIGVTAGGPGTPVYGSFLYSGGTYSTISFPGATEETWVLGINNGGQIVGYYQVLPGGPSYGFLYSRGGYTTVNPPGATVSLAIAINDAGQIVGNYVPGAVPQEIAACKEVTLGGNALVDSYNSTNGSYASQVGAGGHAGSDGNVQTRGAGANITLSDEAAIYGNASATGSVISSGHAEVHGTTSQNQPTSPCDPLGVESIVEKNRPSGHPTSVRLSDKKTETLMAPGTFYLTGVRLGGESMLTVSGTGNATMFIDGDLSISEDASLIVTNGVMLTIYITGNIFTGHHDTEAYHRDREPYPEDSRHSRGGIINQGPSTDLIIYASATKGKQVRIGGNSELGGALYAPLSHISVTGNSEIMGAVRGMTVTGSDNAGFHYDEASTSLLLGW